MTKVNGYLYEMHLHTSEGSACGASSGAEAADYYKSLGYDGIIVTDHFLNGNTAADRTASYEDRIETFCSGYRAAKARGDEIGLSVFFGLEYEYVHGNHFLMYGLDKAFLLAHPELLTLPLPQVIDLVHSVGGLVIQAHPFRDIDWVTEHCLLPRYCDGAEIFNACNSDPANEMARLYAEHYSLISTAGSDNHKVPFYKPYLGAMVLPERVTELKEWIRLLRERKATPTRVPVEI